MNRPEFVGLQLSVLIRSDEAQSQAVLAFLDSVEFKAEMQENVANLIKASLQAHEVRFQEVIISLDRPPEKARPVKRPDVPGNKPSMLGRLFGRR